MIEPIQHLCLVFSQRRVADDRHHFHLGAGSRRAGVK